MAGMAPEATLLSLKVIDSMPQNLHASNLLQALRYVLEINNDNNQLRVHVVLVGLGYDYNAELFACGQSPLCVEASRLVRSGVTVVAASGNTGYGTVQSFHRMTRTVLPYSINDPGNAEPVLTVGSTHRDLPELYGVSYFSSRGPTHDGRPKPDLLAPGDRILCAGAGEMLALATSKNPEYGIEYVENSGTSMAAAHVAGVVAQLLSVHRRLLGQPEEIKRLLMDTAQDLGRAREVQGAGMIDVMAALAQLRSGLAKPATSGQLPETTSQQQGTAAERDLRRQRATNEMARGETAGPVSLMFCYSHQDEILLDELKTHLSPLRRQGKIGMWWDRRISPGTEWHDEIQHNLSGVDIILLLVSASFVASDYAYDIELTQALERHRAGDARVVPVMVRPVDYTGTPFAQIQALPKDARPVTSWGNTDEAWLDVARGVRRVVEELDVRRRASK